MKSVNSLRRFIDAVVGGSREHGAFGRGFTGEYVPHPLLALDDLCVALAAATAREQTLREELVHETHEKETIAASGRALVEYLDSKIAQFAQREQALHQLVAQIEWAGVDAHVPGCCPLCLRYPVEGHEKDCSMAKLAALLPVPEPESET